MDHRLEHESHSGERRLRVEITTNERTMSWAVDMGACANVLLGRGQAGVRFHLRWDGDLANWRCERVDPIAATPIRSMVQPAHQLEEMLSQDPSIFAERQHLHSTNEPGAKQD